MPVLVHCPAAVPSQVASQVNRSKKEVYEAALSPEDTAGADILMSPSHALEELPCAGINDLDISRIISSCQEPPIRRHRYAIDLIAIE